MVFSVFRITNNLGAELPYLDLGPQEGSWPSPEQEYKDCRGRQPIEGENTP